MTKPYDPYAREAQLAIGYAHGQSQARNELGLKPKRPNFKWVDVDEFVMAAIAQGALMLHELHELYERMLADGEHVWRFGPGPDGSLSRQRVKP